MAGGLKYRNITTATTTNIVTGDGRLSHIVHNGSSLAGTITIYDSTTASGTKIATITGAGSRVYDVAFETGLTIVTAGADDITVCYS